MMLGDLARAGVQLQVRSQHAVGAVQCYWPDCGSKSDRVSEGVHEFPVAIGVRPVQEMDSLIGLWHGSTAQLNHALVKRSGAKAALIFWNALRW